MLRILVIGDNHFRRDCIEETQIGVSEVQRVIREYEIRNEPFDVIVNVGDTMNDFGRIELSVENRAIKFIDYLTSKAHVILLIGNHDRANNDVFCTDQHPFLALKKWSNITVVDTPMIKEFKGHSLLLIPYVPIGRLEDAIATLGVVNFSNVSCCFGHQEIRGSSINKIQSHHGNIWPHDRPLLISGHIHQKSRVQANMIYVGSLTAVDFADTTDKILLCVEMDSKSCRLGESIGSGSPKFKILQPLPRLIEIPINVPKRETMNVTAANFNSSNLQNLKTGNNLLRVVIEGTATELKEIRKQQKGGLPEGVKLIYKSKQLKKQNFAQFRKGDDDSKESEVDNDPRSILYKLIAGDEELKTLYAELINK